MKKTKSVGLVSDKTSVLPNESLQTTDVAAGALIWRSNINKINRSYTQETITQDNKNFVNKVSGNGYKIIQRTWKTQKIFYFYLKRILTNNWTIKNKPTLKIEI